MLVSNLKINIEKIYYKIPEHKFEDEDVNAISAFNHATTRAKMIANHLNYKINKVLNIDDDTTESSYIYDRYDKDTDSGRRFIKFLKLLDGRNNLFETESNTPLRSAEYNLWVTFELKRK
ncbi:hypothetical protein [Lacinutrix jangbogonensis]|uniref:hypothetical protein n=1 Tax=Lacinutrix jangbogonensis TaxID=1469557 RepID=UPI00053EA793|nr:hypothetical protein [Lacinutrix jangbogonensis]